MSTFSVKIAIVPSKFAPLDPAEETQIKNLVSLFTHNQMLPKNIIPNLDSIEVKPYLVSADKLKQGDTYDHLTLMTLLEDVGDSKTFVVYVKSTTVSTLDANSLIKLIYDLCDGYMKSANDDKSHFDVMYLAKWADRCDLFNPVSNVFNSTVNLVETSAPQGLQAVLISPSGSTKIKSKLDKVLNYPVSLALTQLIGKNYLKALTTTPNVMSFGSQYATTAGDYVKTHECDDPPSENGKPTPKNSNLSLFIFVIIFLVVVAVFYFLVTMVSGNKTVTMVPPAGAMYTTVAVV
jgi:hypothetical protein